jgi:hypothetical protein
MRPRFIPALFAAACGISGLATGLDEAFSNEAYRAGSYGAAYAEAMDWPDASLAGYGDPSCCPEDYDEVPSDEVPDLERAQLEPEQFGGLGTELLSVNQAQMGYIDNPIVGNQFRFRVDAAYDNFRPDRAEFFYAKCGIFRTAGVGQGFDPRAVGPPLLEQAVDYQELLSYFEFAPFRRLSGFFELPVRFIDPVVNENHRGVGDLIVGFKYALIDDPDLALTFQFKTYTPTGNPFLGLGTNNVNLEPGFLLWRRLSSRTSFQGELRHWIPIDGTDFAGNVIRYGMGLSHDLYRTCGHCCSCGDCCRGLRIAGVGEIVGWTVFNGRATNPLGTIEDAGGDTIVNFKLGGRVTAGRHSIYAGYGHALTGDTWYRDIVRFEYRQVF